MIGIEFGIGSRGIASSKYVHDVTIGCFAYSRAMTPSRTRSSSGCLYKRPGFGICESVCVCGRSGGGGSGCVSCVIGWWG